MLKVRKLHEKRGWAWTTAVAVLKPLLITTTKHEWIDGEKIPASGGCVIAMNHVSHIDPITLAWLLYEHGRLVRYLAKDALFETPIIKYVVRDAGQIPVSRLTTDAAKAFEAACDAVRDGACVGVYPEGTITKDPDGWPMAARTGAARLALASDVPVVPAARWGTRAIYDGYNKKFRPFPRKTVTSVIGEPIDLSAYRGQPVTAQVLREVTDLIMGRVKELVAEARGEQAPEGFYSPVKAEKNGD